MTSTSQTPGSGARAAHPEHLGHVIFITAAAAMGGFLFGYDSAVINGAVEAIRDRYDIGSGTLAQVIAIALIGCAIGAATAGRIADRIGRIRCMRIASVLFTISAIGSALPFALWDLAFWRIIGGFAIGMASVIGPAYIAEVSPAAYRGRLGSFQQAAIVIGIAISQLVNFGILQMADGKQRGTIGGLEAWQWMLGVMVVPALLYGLLSFAIPESPRFLISVGKKDRAREILREVEGRNVDLDARVLEIETAMHREHKSTFKDLLGSRFGFLPIVWVGIGLSIFQQLVGINVAFYYSATLWQSVGIDPTDSFFWSFTTSIVNIIGTVIAMVLVDRIGRKPLALVTRRYGDRSGLRGLGLLRRSGQRQTPDRPGRRRPHRGPCLRALLRPVVGCRGLGLPRRDVPEQDPRRRTRCRRLRPVDRQLGDHRELPEPGRLEPVGHLHHLRMLRRALDPLCAQVREGDQGQGVGGDGLIPAAPLLDHASPARAREPGTRASAYVIVRVRRRTAAGCATPPRPASHRTADAAPGCPPPVLPAAAG